MKKDKTDFDIRVWKALERIPAGRVTTYKEIARFIGTRAYRAVGRALGRNPDAPKIPCHRVVNSDGRIGGYSAEGGIARKIELLESEGISVSDGKIDAFEKVLYNFDDWRHH